MTELELRRHRYCTRATTNSLEQATNYYRPHCDRALFRALQSRKNAYYMLYLVSGRLSSTLYAKRVQLKLLSYIVRMDELDDEKRPKFKMTSVQQDTFDELLEAVD